MNANKAEAGKKYLSKSGVPVTLLEVKGSKVVLKIETTGNKVEVDGSYELKPYSESGVNKDARLLLKANGNGKAAGGRRKERAGTLAALIDPFLMAGTKTIQEIAAELKKKAGGLAAGKDLEANCRARLFTFRRKGYRVERDDKKRVRVVKKG